MSFSPNESQFSNPETGAAREFSHSLVLIYAPRTILVAKQDIDDYMVRAEVAAMEAQIEPDAIHDWEFSTNYNQREFLHGPFCEKKDAS